MEDEQAEDGQLPDIENRIKSLIEKRFSNGFDRYYLSQLGNDLGEYRHILEKESGFRLAQYLSKKMGFELASSGPYNNILFISAQKNGCSGYRAGESALPRFSRRFWAAFVKPLDSGKRRFIDISTGFFKDHEDAPSSSDADMREIQSRFIRDYSADNESSAREVVIKIDEWLEEQGLERSQFLAHDKKSMERSKTILDDVLSALSSDQLKRVSLPLDVIQSLHRARD